MLNCIFLPDKVDSESSHYESYGEEEGEFVKDRAHYVHWRSSQPTIRPDSESRICGYLWRKKWLGQWSRQLFIIKQNSLLVSLTVVKSAIKNMPLMQTVFLNLNRLPFMCSQFRGQRRAV